ncbi:MAG: MOSC N-terminal beta barrel domain-containing protein [Cyclobacteriaceae bacterium]
MIEVTGLYIYPIKSLQGVEVSEAEVLERGFKHDRRWMIVDENNKFITQRTHPHLSQIEIKVSENKIIASYPGHMDLQVPLSIESGERVEVSVWEHQVEALEANGEQNKWISKVAGTPCKLVFMPESASRPISPERARNNENVSFADGYPYLIISEASLEDLNTRMDVALPMHRFRPNIVVSGTEPYAEDSWRDFSIGNVNFYGTHGCKRCVFTTIDQETGKKGTEPLKTLATYRREGKDVVFGLNTMAESRGVVRVGDQVFLSNIHPSRASG